MRVSPVRLKMRDERRKMPTVTVRRLSDATHRALKARAARNRRSLEAEICHILEESISPKPRLKIGSELAAFGRRYGGIEIDLERSSEPIEPAKFS